MYINGAEIWQWWHKACLQGDGWLQPGWNCLACNSAGIYHTAPMSESAQLNTAIRLFVRCIYISLFFQASSWSAYSEQLTMRATLENTPGSSWKITSRQNKGSQRSGVSRSYNNPVTKETSHKSEVTRKSYLICNRNCWQNLHEIPKTSFPQDITIHIISDEFPKISTNLNAVDLLSTWIMWR